VSSAFEELPAHYRPASTMTSASWCRLPIKSRSPWRTPSPTVTSVYAAVPA